MQRQVSDLQEELKKRVFEGRAGGGAVLAKVNGARELVEVKIQPDAVDPADVGMLEDMVRGAVNDALRQAEETSSEEMQRITGGMGLPGIP